MARDFAVVVAADEASGIGVDGTLPWRIPSEMAFFKRLTTTAPAGARNAVIMGRKTYDSIAPKFRPLAGRLNVVLTRTSSEDTEGVRHARSLDEALAIAAEAGVADVFVIGGGQVYAEALADPRCARVHLTRVHATYACDTFLPPLEARFRLVSRDGPHVDGETSYTFERYER